MEPLSRRDAVSQRGFTLLENLIVVSIIATLVAIAAPSWFAFRDRQALNAARSEALSAIRSAQKKAIQRREKWQTSFREFEDRVQWAVHPASADALAQAHWNNLPENVRLDSETTLRLVKGVRRVQFNYLGQVNGQLGRVTFSTENSETTKRCVVVSTLLGAVRTGENRATKDNGKSCW